MVISRTQRLMRLACQWWVATGFLAPVILLATGTVSIPGRSTILRAVALLAASVICNRIEFRINYSASASGESMVLSPNVQPIALAALTLDPLMAFAVGFLGVVIDEFRYPRDRVYVFNMASIGLTTAVSAALCAWLFHGVVSTGLLLPAAFVATLSIELMSTFWYGMFAEVRRPGSSAGFVRVAARIMVFQMILTILAVVLVLPYMHSLPIAALVFGVFQGLTYLSLKIANSEQLQRRKNAHMHEAFSRYLPESIVEGMSELGQEIELGGEEREITVMFVDVRNFTGWAEKLTPAEIITQLNELMTLLTDAIFETEGTLDKFTGDGLMAFWGAPVEQPDHAERAARTALLMQDKLDICNEQRLADGRPPFAIGIGINSGPAIVGNVGHTSRLDYTAIGDTVNLASRLESATKEHGVGILTSLDTYSYLRGELRDHCDRLADTQMKGKAETVAVFALRREPVVRPAASTSTPPDDLVARLLGLVPNESSTPMDEPQGQHQADAEAA